MLRTGYRRRLRPAWRRKVLRQPSRVRVLIHLAAANYRLGTGGVGGFSDFSPAHSSRQDDSSSRRAGRWAPSQADECAIFSLVLASTPSGAETVGRSVLALERPPRSLPGTAERGEVGGRGLGRSEEVQPSTPATSGDADRRHRTIPRLQDRLSRHSALLHKISRRGASLPGVDTTRRR